MRREKVGDNNEPEQLAIYRALNINAVQIGISKSITQKLKQDAIFQV
ncbi:MAG: hypothetical protein PHD43_21760 [Methylococcales bacterium]|nr:hypothetical protein [Methylococcales bacterium]